MHIVKISIVISVKKGRVCRFSIVFYKCLCTVHTEVRVMYLFIPDRRWSVSENGVDSPYCGGYLHPCASFRALWRQIRNDAKRSTEHYVETDTNLMINNIHLHSPHKELIFWSGASHVINITITNTSIKTTDLSFGVPHDGVNRISLYIENCFIRSSRIGFGKLSQPLLSVTLPFMTTPHHMN